jgi:hypothetical protein
LRMRIGIRMGAGTAFPVSLLASSEFLFLGARRSYADGVAIFQIGLQGRLACVPRSRIRLGLVGRSAPIEPVVEIVRDNSEQNADSHEGGGEEASPALGHHEHPPGLCGQTGPGGKL